MPDMHYLSTRGGAQPVRFSQALTNGLAPDGGLYVPDHWPAYADRQPGGLTDVAPRVLAGFFEGDALAEHVRGIVTEAFNFPASLTPLDARTDVLELFHGPTAAFKDFGARFLAAAMARLERDRPLHILVATSGDTGGAVAAAFHRRPGVRVTVLFPKGMVSPTQEAQLTCWDDNVQSFAVRGAFDDCQRLVKAAFSDAALRERFDLSSANSINVGRLLPQMCYFASTSLDIFARYGEPVSFVVPSGNLGHATACAWARQIGLPIGQIVLAHNANRTMPDYLTSGVWRPSPTIPTLASAMDVGDPSNGERLRHFYPSLEDLRAAVTAYTIDDDAIRARIRAGWEVGGHVWCPHTAAGVEAHVRHSRAQGSAGRWVVAATAHPAKFPEVVEPLIGRAVDTPPSLARLFDAAKPAPEIDPSLDALRAALVS